MSDIQIPILKAEVKFYLRCAECNELNIVQINMLDFLINKNLPTRKYCEHCGTKKAEMIFLWDKSRIQQSEFISKEESKP